MSEIILVWFLKMIKASTIFHCGIYHYHSFIVYNTSVLFGPILGAVHMYSAVYKCVYIHYHHHHYDLDHHHHPTLHHHLPASSRGQAHFLKSTKVVPGLYWKPGTGRCCCVHRHTAAPPSLLQSPVEASYTQLGSLQLLIWNIDGSLWGPPHFFFNAPINYPYTQ